MLFYAFGIDRTAAASLTNVALTVVTLTTSLLIVGAGGDHLAGLPQALARRSLPNRLQFHQCLERVVARARRHRHLMAVFALDLDRFKHVNDTLGHATGDALLSDVGIGRVNREPTPSRLGPRTHFTHASQNRNRACERTVLQHRNAPKDSGRAFVAWSPRPTHDLTVIGK